MIPELLPWHRSQWQRIERGIRSGQVPHALLLRGGAGNGKALFAARLAAMLLCSCDDPPCGGCKSCRLCAAGSHPDWIEVTIREDRREIVIEQIRDLIHSVGLTARLSRYKAVIVNPAEQMNRHAANTLLKTLEEPPGNTVFLLVSSNHSLLLATIRSRCQMIDFPLADPDIAVEWLRGKVPDNLHEESREIRQLERQGDIRWRKDIDTWQADSDTGAKFSNRPERPDDAWIPAPARLLALAHGAPIRAVKLLDGHSIKVRSGLERDLDALLAGRSDPMAVASRWKELGRDAVSSWLTDILAERLRESVLGPDGPRGAAPAHFSRLLSMLDRCLAVRGGVLARSNANEQLALERLALEIAVERAGDRRMR